MQIESKTVLTVSLNLTLEESESFALSQFLLDSLLGSLKDERALTAPTIGFEQAQEIYYNLVPEKVYNEYIASKKKAIEKLNKRYRSS